MYNVCSTLFQQIEAIISASVSIATSKKLKEFLEVTFSYDFLKGKIGFWII